MREEDRLTQENRTKSSDEKLLKITLTDTMPITFHTERERKKMQTHTARTNKHRARISSELLSERSLKDRCYPQNYFLSSFDSYSAAPLPSSLLSLSTSQQKFTCHSFTQPGGKLNLRVYDCQNIIKKPNWQISEIISKQVFYSIQCYITALTFHQSLALDFYNEAIFCQSLMLIKC